MVIISHAEPGDTRIQLRSKGQGQYERRKGLESQNKEEISKKIIQYMIISRKNLKQNKGGVKVIHSYRMFELPRAEPRDKRNVIMWTEREEKRGGRSED
jgi:hypothetical protein